VQLRNDGPDEVTVAQVLINDSYWGFSMEDQTLGRLESADLHIAYPWEEGLPVNIVLVTATGVTIDHEVEAAALTPPIDLSTLGLYALLGIYIGVIPVAIGILWFPALSRASKRWLGFFLAFTVGLLAFLLVDTIAEGLELSSEAPAVLDGLSLFVIGVAVAVLALSTLEAALERRGGEETLERRGGEETLERRGGEGALGGLQLAYLIAAGIGLHNLGEGLAVGAALAAGEAALGTFLILGFALHNTTEGLAIVSPLGRGGAERPAIKHFVALGALAGAPAIAGAWLGGFAFSPAWAALAFGVAAGAIAQVVWRLVRSMDEGRAFATPFGAIGFMAGLAVMYLTGLLTI
jgi:ZIP family zinc transporter